MLDLINQYSGRKKNVAHTDLSSVGQPLAYCPSLNPWLVTRVYQCVCVCVRGACVCLPHLHHLIYLKDVH